VKIFRYQVYIYVGLILTLLKAVLKREDRASNKDVTAKRREILKAIFIPAAQRSFSIYVPN